MPLSRLKHSNLYTKVNKFRYLQKLSKESGVVHKDQVYQSKTDNISEKYNLYEIQECESDAEWVDCNDFSMTEPAESEISANLTGDNDGIEEISAFEFRTICDKNSIDNEHDPLNKNFTKNMKEKILHWTINHIGDIKLSAVTEILQILRSEGYLDFPKTASKFLGFKHRVNSRPMISHRRTIGEYFYLGIENSLLKRIKSNIYTEESIHILVHIDGMSIYHNSKKQLWPILVKLYHKDYECPPFVVALYHGDSKPLDVDDFLRDFVEETKKLITNGVFIDSRLYSFHLVAIIADSPARAFIKCIKGPTGFFGCERCTIKGITVNRRRVYPNINCIKRTKESFTIQTQKEHHKENSKTKEKIITPLIEIPNFDPVMQIPLEIMHLLFLNVMKSLAEKWVERKKNKYKLTPEKLQEFSDLMNSLTPFVPEEFQRNTFDIAEISHWKATQYAFFLLYASGIILKFVLDDEQYKHFLHLHVAARILCNNKWAINYANYADEFLRSFFILMPTFYGFEAQVMHAHNLIHLADDAKYFGTTLSNLSAFWGENFIGKLKNYVTSMARPLSQIVNRICGTELKETIEIKKREVIKNLILKKQNEVIERDQISLLAIQSIYYNYLILRDVAPNNVVELASGEIFFIYNLFIKQKLVLDNKTSDDIYIEGYRVEKTKNVFKVPCPSKDIGIFKIKKFFECLELVPLKEVKKKCLHIKIENELYAISLLHTDN